MKKNILSKVIFTTLILSFFCSVCIAALGIAAKNNFIETMPYHKYRGMSFGFSAEHIITFYVNMEDARNWSEICMWDLYPWDKRYQIKNRDVACIKQLQNIWGGNLTRSKAITFELLSGFEQVTKLDLSYLDVNSTTSISPLPHLKYLRLCNTRFSDGNWSFLSSLTNLTALYLNSTQISDEDLRYLSVLNKLEILCLDGTKISDAGLKYLANLSNIRVLSLDGTKISNNGLQYLSKLKNIQYLSLSYTNVSDAGLQHLALLPLLREVHLKYCHITKKELYNLKRVEVLNLANCNISGARFSAFHKLDVLCLDGKKTNLDQQMISDLAKIDTLREIYTELYEEQYQEILQKWRRHLPSVEIFKGSIPRDINTFIEKNIKVFAAAIGVKPRKSNSIYKY
ncbi:leucine-rich repeat domain-containing protein [Candidatus Uabimicrobium amorphum]|uniref:Adenylate cyclase n=1 Tax=Uabimicrobium amorphum TaxID=2596890 RepID=A0A5S9IIJ5_UABAM|nr:hypothetical protein [Candidatus Uabimicrobium amorphum]BBM82126.1 adenylate cyclase [Candidatus Uabimicrobium amorphum]